MGGNRYTPLDISATTQSYQEVYYTSQTFAKQYPAFFRWDIGVYFKMNRRKYNWRLSVDFQNITNQQNLFSTRYDFEKQTTINNYGLGFIPVINYKVEF
jgi:outer membrane receptor protein involved in Fe transport